MYKLLMSWNIKAGVEQEYFEFVVRELCRALPNSAFNRPSAWYTVYGNRPHSPAASPTARRDPQSHQQPRVEIA